MGVLSLIHSASNIDVPKEIIGKVQSRLFKFLWKNKRDKIKRTSFYQDYKDGGLRMIDIETMVKALRLAWIPRLLKIGSLNWKTVPDYYFKKYDGLGLLLKCNYRVEDFKDIPHFYRDISLFFNELKSLYYNRNDHETILFNNKEILIGGQPFLFQEWLNKEIKTIMDLLDSEGNVLSFAEFKSKFQLKKTTFLHFCQVISVIPSHLLQRARELKVSSDDSKFYDDSATFQINEHSYLDLMKAKAKDFYWLLVNKMHTNSHAGPKCWEKSITSENICWNQIFQSIRETSKENKLREFHFKVIHRIFVTKKELFRFKIKEDGDCIYC